MMQARAAGLVLALALALAGARAECPAGIRYTAGTSASRPLLLGGASERGRCQGNRCGSRNDYWGKQCQLAPASAWGMCSEDQTAAVRELARKTVGDAGLNTSPCELLPYLRGRTLWLLGDSHMKSLFWALACFLVDFAAHEACQASTDPTAMSELTNLPKVPGNNNCIHLTGPGGGRVCMVEVVLGTSLLNSTAVAEGGVLPLLRKKFAQPQDIFYVNFGSWHRKNQRDWDTFVPSLEALGSYYQETKDQWPHLLFRENSAMHIKDLEHQTCNPAPGYAFDSGTGKLEQSSQAAADTDTQWTIGKMIVDTAGDVLPRFNLPIVHSWNYTMPLHNAHVGSRFVSELDCLHYCLPGAPQLWIYDLLAALRVGKGGVTPLAVPSQPEPSSASVPLFSRLFGGLGRDREAMRMPTSGPGHFDCKPTRILF